MNESKNMGSLNFVQLVRDGLIDHAGMYSQVKGWSKRAIETLLDDMRNEAFGIQMFENTGANQSKIQRLASMIDFIATEFCPNYDYYRKTTAKDKQENTEHEEKRRDTAAAKRLASQELQEVKQELVTAGLIVDGQWAKDVSDFACLATELKETFGIVGERKQHGKTCYAWKDCALFAGFHTDKKSLECARGCSQYTQHGEIANTIRAICKKVHTKYVK